MGLSDNVIPAIITTLTPLVGQDDSVSPHIRVIRYGEQLQVAQPPECWIVNVSASFPEKQGSDLEQSDWQFELRLIHPYENDQMQPEVVLSALIEPFRNVFRSHIHMGMPTKISRGRILSATWQYAILNEVIYRVVNLRLAVREKIPVQISP